MAVSQWMYLSWKIQDIINQAWWHIPATPALGKRKEEDHKPKVILGYIVGLRPAWTAWDCFKKMESSPLFDKESVDLLGSSGKTGLSFVIGTNKTNGNHLDEINHGESTHVGLEASAWSVCSFSPPSTSIVQYTMRFGAKDLRPWTSMITTWKQNHIRWI